MKGNEIGALLRMCREWKGMSQEQIAKHLKVDRSKVSRIETGKDIPSINEVMMWAEVTDSREFIGIYVAGREKWQQVMKLDHFLAEIGA